MIMVNKKLISAIYCGKNCQEEAWNNGHEEVCGEDDMNEAKS